MPESKVFVHSYRKQAQLALAFSRKSLKELENWKMTHEEESLRQAGEKCWGAFIQILEAIGKQRTHSHGQVVSLFNRVYNKTFDKDLETLYLRSYELHRSFYGGTDNPQIDEGNIKTCVNKINILVSRYNLLG